MDSSFKDYLQYFLKKYGMNPDEVSFDYGLNYFYDQIIQKNHISKYIDFSLAFTLIFELYEDGIYLYQKEYPLTEAYAARKDEWIEDKVAGMFSTENYIERFLISDAVKQGVYENESKYAMGNPYLLSSKECTIKCVVQEITKDFFSVDPRDKDNFDKKAEYVKKKLYGKGGVIYRLKKESLFDNTQYNPEKCKLIYFIYEMEHYKLLDYLNRENFDLFQFLKKSSMESIDNSVLGQGNYKWETKFGNTTRFIRNSLEKEMNLQDKDKIWLAFNQVIKQWESLMLNVARQIEIHAIEKRPSLELNKIKNMQQQVSNSLTPVLGVEATQCSMIEKFYFFILQCEFLGEANDAKKINLMPIKANYNVPPELVLKMQLLHTEKIPLDCVEEFIEAYADLLVDYVCLKKVSGKDERKKQKRRIRESSKTVFDLLESYCRRRPEINRSKRITTLYIISCLQAILEDDNNVNFEYKSFGLGGSKTRKVSGALRKTDTVILDSLKAYWERKIENHLFANLGRYEVIEMITEFQIVCFDMMMNIYSAKSLSEMIYVHHAYYDNLKILLSDFLAGI